MGAVAVVECQRNDAPILAAQLARVVVGNDVACEGAAANKGQRVAECHLRERTGVGAAREQ